MKQDPVSPEPSAPVPASSTDPAHDARTRWRSKEVSFRLPVPPRIRMAATAGTAGSWGISAVLARSDTMNVDPTWIWPAVALTLGCMAYDAAMRVADRRR
ncbi:hypothetical protein [Streptomyces sp. NPDC050982]|uniref:hypothetical protein n=1 Tax=Streptomyces sp. NPDC050982 TaxID=3154746 RepID=UPI0033F6CA8E